MPSGVRVCWVLLTIAIVLVVQRDSAAQVEYSYTFTSGPSGDHFLWPDSLNDGDYLEPLFSYDGALGIGNESNNIVLVGGNYEAAANSRLIDGDALWGNPRSQAQAGECCSDDSRVYFDFYSLDEYPQRLSFDFAWTSSEAVFVDGQWVGPPIQEVSIDVIDSQGGFESLLVPLPFSFNAGPAIGGLELGYEGRVRIDATQLESLADIAEISISFQPLFIEPNDFPSSAVAEFAIDNFAINSEFQSSGSDVFPSVNDGENVSGATLTINTSVDNGTWEIYTEVTNAGTESTTFSVFADPAGGLTVTELPTFYPIGPEERAYVKLAELDSTRLSGTYATDFTFLNDTNTGDEDDTITYQVALHDPPDLSSNNGSPVVLSNLPSSLSIANASALAHEGAIRAAIELSSVTVDGPFQVSTFAGTSTGFANNEFVRAGDTAMASVAAARGLPSGTHTGTVRVAVRSVADSGFFLAGEETLSDVVWQVQTGVAPRAVAMRSLGAGAQFAQEDLEIHGPETGAAIIHGTSSAPQQVALTFAVDAPDGSESGVTLVGTPIDLDFELSGDLYVLQLSYLDALLPVTVAESDLRLMYLSDNAAQWEPAILGNSDGGLGASFFSGSFDAYLASLSGGDAALSAFGVDTSANTVWAVLDHHSLFAIGSAVELQSCDFDGDLDCDIDDLEALLAQGPIAPGVSVAAGENEHFDLNRDEVIDLRDRDLWLARAADENGFDAPYLLGDINLDGAVNDEDLSLLEANLFANTLSWSDGNLNGDGVVDVRDFNLWYSHRYTSSLQTSAVPEPGSFAVVLVLLSSMLLGVRPRHEARHGRK